MDTFVDLSRKLYDIACAIFELLRRHDSNVCEFRAGDDTGEDVVDGGAHVGVHLIAVDVVHGHRPGLLELCELRLLATRTVGYVAGGAVGETKELHRHVD